MIDLSGKTNEELLSAARSSENKDTLRSMCIKLDLSFSGNSGISTLREKVVQALEARTKSEQTPEARAAVMEEVMASMGVVEETPVSILGLPANILMTMDPTVKGLSEAERGAIVEARNMRLRRVRVTNLDPADAELDGVLKFAINKYIGSIGRFVPFGEENEYGWHVEEIILESLRTETYCQRVKNRSGSKFGIKKYKTAQLPKYNIEYLDDLTQEELDLLAKDQLARGAIDQAGTNVIT